MRGKRVILSLTDPVARRLGYSRDEAWDTMLRRHSFYPISQTEPQDVFVAGYPKSGNTWVQHLITGILYGIDTRYLPDRLSQETVPDVHFKRYYKRFGDVCFFKTHYTPRPQYRRVIHLVRDGRDAMASYHVMLQNEGRDISLEAMITEGRGLFPCKWHEHARQWLENPYDAEILRLRYEDLQTDPLKELHRICEFAGIERDDELLQRVMVGCSFEEMQRREREFGWDQGWAVDRPFVRRGAVHGYLDEIPAHLVRVFETESHACLKELGYLDAAPPLERGPDHDEVPGP